MAPASSTKDISLPAELVVNILSWLSWRDILRCRLVSRSFRDIVDGEDQLQYAIELALAGYVETGWLLSSLDIPTRRDLLRRRQRISQETPPPAWKLLSYDLSNHYHSVTRSPPNASYVGNVICLPERSTGSLWLYPDVVTYIALFSADQAEITTQTWTCRYEPFSAFKIDPSQDLIVMLAHFAERSTDWKLQYVCKIKCRSLSHTHTLNPATDDVLLSFSESVLNLSVPTIEIFGSTIAVAFTDSEKTSSGGYLEQIIFIDNKTHKIFSRFACPCPHEPLISKTEPGLILLDSTAFILVSRGTPYGTISVYTITDQYVASAEGIYRAIAPVASFQLPPLRPGVLFEPSIIRPCYSTSYHTRHIPKDFHRAISHRTPFELSPEICLLHLDFRYYALGYDKSSMGIFADLRNSEGATDIHHVFSLAPFFRALETYQAGIVKLDPDGNAFLTPWAAWGPPNSRSFEIRTKITQVASHGSQVYVSHYSDSQGDVIMDFNTLHEARMPSNTLSAEDVSGYRFVGVDQPTRIPKRDVFVDDVLGYLPYREHRLVEPDVTQAFNLLDPSDRCVFGGDPWISWCTQATPDNWAEVEDRIHTLFV